MGGKFRLFILAGMIAILLSVPDRVEAADGWESKSDKG